MKEIERKLLVTDNSYHTLALPKTTNSYLFLLKEFAKRKILHE